MRWRFQENMILSPDWAAAHRGGDSHEPPLIELIATDMAATRRAALEDACKAMCPKCAAGLKIFKGWDGFPRHDDGAFTSTCAAYPIRALAKEKGIEL